MRRNHSLSFHSNSCYRYSFPVLLKLWWGMSAAWLQPSMSTGNKCHAITLLWLGNIPCMYLYMNEVPRRTPTAKSQLLQARREHLNHRFVQIGGQFYRDTWAPLLQCAGLATAVSWCLKASPSSAVSCWRGWALLSCREYTRVSGEFWTLMPRFVAFSYDNLERNVTVERATWYTLFREHYRWWCVLFGSFFFLL